MSPAPSGRSIRDRSPRLSAEMGRSRDGGSPSSPNAHHRVSFDRGACPPAQSLASRRSGMSDGHMQRTYQEAMRQRRTSLPANSLSMGKHNVSTSSVSEARGLIADMLINRDLPSNVATCLRAVASLLEQKAVPMHGLNDFGLPCVVENPYSGEQLIVSGASKPRVSNITFSTVTSATGLPTIAAEPSRPRSSSYWKPDPSPSSHEPPPSLDQIRKEAVARKESGSLVDAVVTTVDGQQYNTKELDADAELETVADWSFPIFHFAKRYPTTILSRLTYSVFRQADFFRIFKVSPIKFFNYFHALEKGYWEIPCPSSSPDSLLPPPLMPNQTIMGAMSTLELMALYTAAAMHDFDHPGRTNAFLVAAEDKKAILYNDRSVLENHHAAESWRLLCQTDNCFIESLDAAEIKRFRYLVLEYILATDLKQHFEIIMTFNEKTNDMDMSNESDRLLLAKLIIKMADINSPTKPYNLHRQWTDRICEEFYEQGDEEKRRGLPITPYMDRSDAQMAKLQDSFIAHVVSPLAVAMNEAGLLPVLPGLMEPEMMMNLKHNHQKWLHEIDAMGSSNNNNNNNSNNNGGLSNGVIEEESTASDSPDPRKDSSSLDSDPE